MHSYWKTGRVSNLIHFSCLFWSCWLSNSAHIGTVPFLASCHHNRRTSWTKRAVSKLSCLFYHVFLAIQLTLVLYTLLESLLLLSHPRSRPYIYFSTYGKSDADALQLRAKVNGRVLGHCGRSRRLLLFFFVWRWFYLKGQLSSFPVFLLFQTTFATKPFLPSQLKRIRWHSISDGNYDGHLNVSFLWLKCHCDKSTKIWNVSVTLDFWRELWRLLARVISTIKVSLW